ncbi:unnamed protein product, partial [Closterium sp. NIES-54]
PQQKRVEEDPRPQQQVRLQAQQERVEEEPQVHQQEQQPRQMLQQQLLEKAEQQRLRDLPEPALARFVRGTLPSPPVSSDLSLSLSRWSRRSPLSRAVSPEPCLSGYRANGLFHLSTGTYVDSVPPPGANVVSDMWPYKVKRLPGSPPVFKASYVARGFTQRDYRLHSLDISTTFLQRSLHKQIWLRRLPSCTGSFPPGTHWQVRRLVYGMRQAPHEWHDTLCMTLAALDFFPSSADPSLFVRHGLTPFRVLVYVEDLHYLGLQITRDRAARTITLTRSHMVEHILTRFRFPFSNVQLNPLVVDHGLTAPPGDEPFESSGPYPELVGCLMYLMTCTRPDLAYPLSAFTHFVAPGRHQPSHWYAARGWRTVRQSCTLPPLQPKSFAGCLSSSPTLVSGLALPQSCSPTTCLLTCCVRSSD